MDDGKETNQVHHTLHQPMGTMIPFFFSFFMAAPVSYGHSQAALKSELKLLAHATATATLDLSRACNLPHSLQQCQIPSPLSKARDRTSILVDTMSGS